MNKRSGLILLLALVSLSLYAQNERKVIRGGIRAYEEGAFEDAEVEFRKAKSINQESYEAEFNTGTALYSQEKYEETVKQYESLLAQTGDGDSEKTARIWHNIGNSLLESQQFGPSIEAFKNSLRENPMDEDTRYNLAYAKQKLKEQQQEQNQDQDQDQEKQQQEQDQDKDQQKEEEQNSEQEDQQQEKQQAEPREISKEDAERMLKAIQQQEKDVKEKVDKEKAAAAKVKTEKDW